MNTDKKFIVVYDNKYDDAQTLVWGLGASEDEAYANCFQNMKERSEGLKVFPCSQSVYNLVNAVGGYEAVEKIFITPQDEAVLRPSNDFTSAFCEKYNLPEDARLALQEEFQRQMDTHLTRLKDYFS